MQVGRGSSGVIRIGCGQGFWGDTPGAPVDQVRRGPLDYLMLDYLAEVTMSILQKQRRRDPGAGFARDFVPLMEEIFPDVCRRGIRVLTNAGGVNVEGCRDALIEAARAAGVSGRATIGTVTGDDLLVRLPELIESGHPLRNMDDGRPLAEILDQVESANAYIGAGPLLEALAGGADVVVTGRSTDTALTYAPMMHAFGWRRDDWDRIAHGIVAGHVNECGAQATGGNCQFAWREIPDLDDVGYPIVEATPAGSFVLTKHEGTGGRVSVPIVKEQILYEMGDPREYVTPDGIADFTTIRLEDDGPDRVRVSGVRGRPRTDQLKVSISYRAGFKAVGTLVYAWPDAVEKAERAGEILRARLQRLGLALDRVRTEIVGWNATAGPLAGPPRPDQPEVVLRVAVHSDSRDAVERFSQELAPLVLTGPPSATGFAGGRPRVQDVVAFWPALIDRDQVEPRLRVEVRAA
jgi:hypothetical protein